MEDNRATSDDDAPLSWRVIEAVAEAKDTDPAELDFALEDYVDTDVLNRLSELENDSWTFSFELAEHTVTVTGTGIVLINGDHAEVVTTQ